MNLTREEALFALVVQTPVERRAAFLERVCEGDASLHARIEALLAAHDGTGVIPAGDSVSEALTPTLELAEPVADEAVGQTLGRYKLLERVGEGGCGVVYVAEQTEPVRRRVALKVIKLGMDTKQVVARFEAERQALAMMDHPNIAKVLDAGTTDMGRPYFVMELVRGIKITDYCDQGNLSTQSRLELFIKVCQAIQHAHQKGIIHRDIKPSNILVTLHDGVPVPKVIDFGIAKATEGRLTEATVYTQLHQFIGTPAYMSPEQAEMSGLDIDTRSDIYSLGVLLYELLTGSTPFDGKELMSGGIDAMRKTIREQEPPKPSTRLGTLGADQLTTTAKRRSSDTSKLLHQLKGDLDWIVMKCLEKDRQRRYETANGLAADIARHLSNEPVTARPPSAAYRFQKAFRRNKLLCTAATIVAVALVLGLSSAAVGFRQAVRQRDRAESLRVAAEQARQSESAMRVEAQVREEAAIMQSYASDMRQVERAVASSDLSVARSILAELRPKSTGDRDLRGWEWRHFWEQSRGDPSQILMTVTGRVGRLKFRADGNLLALSLGRDLEIWDWRKHSRVFQATNALEPVFAKVGSRLAFLRRNKSATNMVPTVLNTETWTETALPAVEGVTSVLRFGFVDQDRSLILQGRGARTGGIESNFLLLALDAATGRELWRRGDVLAESEDFENLSENGGTLAFEVPGNQILVLDMENGRERYKIRVPYRTSVRIAVSYDGAQIRAFSLGYRQPPIWLWNSRTGVSEGQFDGVPDVLTDMQFTAGDRYLITSGRDATIRVWDWRERRLIRSVMVPEEIVQELAVAPDNRTLATVTRYRTRPTGTIRIWDLGSPEREKGSRVLSVASSEIPEFRVPVFSADGRSLLGVDEDGVLKQWNVATHTVTRSWPLLGGNDPGLQVDAASERALALQPDGDLRLLNLGTGSVETNALGDSRFYRAWFVNGEKRLLTVRKSQEEGATRLNVPTVRTVEVWDLESRKAVYSFVYTNFPRVKDLGPIFLSKDRGVFAFDTSGGLVVNILGETNTPTRLLKVPKGLGSSNPFSAFDMSPDRRWVVAAQLFNEGISIWDQRTGTHSLLPNGGGGVVALFFNPDGTRLIEGDIFKASLNIWDVNSRRQVAALPMKILAFAGAISSDGRAIACYSPAGQLETWTAPSFEEITAEEAKVPPPLGYGGPGMIETKHP